MQPDGLRYKSKAAGSPYGKDGMGLTMSCIKCGKHRNRGLLKAVKIAGTRFYKCEDGCKG
jgi:hypothetical protein